MWQIRFEGDLFKKFQKLDSTTQKRIGDFLDKKLKKNPQNYSIQLIGNAQRFRARVGDYRIIFELKNNDLIILLLNIDHRSKIYK